MKLGSRRRRSWRTGAVPNSSRRSQSRKSVRPLHKRDLYSTKARAFRPKSSNTIPLPSSMRSAETWMHGVHFPTPINGTPETARLLQHWRHHQFSSVRPFFCQVEAVETAIWLIEVAPQSRNGKRLLDHLASANRRCQPRAAASRAETGHRRRQDHRHGHAHRLANGQRSAAPGEQLFYAWLSSLRTRLDGQRPAAHYSALRPRQLLRQRGTSSRRYV